MKITVNGKEKSFNNICLLEDIITSICKTPKRVIAELNGKIVKSPAWPDTKISEGDILELITFVGGG